METKTKEILVTVALIACVVLVFGKMFTGVMASR